MEDKKMLKNNNNPLLNITSKASQKITNSAQYTEELNKEIAILKNKLENKTDYIDDFKIIPESLDEIEKEISTLKNKMWEFSWLIGKRLIVVREKYLKELEFTNISEYANEKFNFSHGTTMNIIFIAKNFTQSQTFDFGSKLYLLRTLDDNTKHKYLEWMKNSNPSANEIRERIKSEIKKAGRPKKEISLSKVKMIVDFRKMGVEIEKEKENEFLNRLKALINEYSKGD
ncbi:MAG: hypothetical protein OEV44_10140 [Spirochaetota bacterium]|nr:hypothetical protein [Spirochaetota bacterium]